MVTLIRWWTGEGVLQTFSSVYEIGAALMRKAAKGRFQTCHEIFPVNRNRKYGCAPLYKAKVKCLQQPTATSYACFSSIYAVSATASLHVCVKQDGTVPPLDPFEELERRLRAQAAEQSAVEEIKGLGDAWGTIHYCKGGILFGILLISKLLSIAVHPKMKWVQVVLCCIGQIECKHILPHCATCHQMLHAVWT